MTGQINWQGILIDYELTFKKVKNINLRVKPDGTVQVSAPKWVGKAGVERFLLGHGQWIQNCRSRLQQQSQARSQPHPVLWGEEVFEELLEELYPAFRQWVPRLPKLTVRTMKTRWGSCTPGKCRITINRVLLSAPKDCIRYVLVHELVHFIHLDHSPRFYAAMDHFLPEHRQLRKKLRELNLL